MVKGRVEKRFKSGLVEATVWTNTNKDKKGKEFETRTVSLSRSYLDKDEEWQNTGSMRTQDIPRVLLVLNKANEHLLNVKEEEGRKKKKKDKEEVEEEDVEED